MEQSVDKIYTPIRVRNIVAVVQRCKDQHLQFEPALRRFPIHGRGQPTGLPSLRVVRALSHFGNDMHAES